MTIAEFETIYDKDRPTAAETDIIFDTLQKCGQDSDYLYLLRDFYRKQARLLAAILEVEGGTLKDFKKQMTQFKRAEKDLQAFQQKADENQKKVLFCEWFCFIERFLGFQIDRNRNLNDFISFVNIVTREQKKKKKNYKK